MKLEVKRVYLGDTYTIGKLSIDGDYFCDTLEDKVRDLNKNGKLDEFEQKVYGKTAIPYGTYKVVYNFSPRFKKQLPRLLDVPNFDGVLIHAGNTSEDTSGCILLGENKIKGRVINSAVHSKRLNDIIANAYFNKQDISITII